MNCQKLFIPINKYVTPPQSTPCTLHQYQYGTFFVPCSDGQIFVLLFEYILGQVLCLWYTNKRDSLCCTTAMHKTISRCPSTETPTYTRSNVLHTIHVQPGFTPTGIDVRPFRVQLPIEVPRLSRQVTLDTTTF